MENYLINYLPILMLLIIAFAMAVMGLGLSYVFSSKIAKIRGNDDEKTSSYECGFDAMSDNEIRFNVRYYLVAILFIIFDIEIAFLFPWAVSLGEIGLFGFWSMAVFLGVLTAGFVYEWKKGALDWE